MARFCPDCGTPRVDGGSICAGCGHIFAISGDVPVEAEVPEPSLAATPDREGPEPPEAETESSPATGGWRRPRVILAAIAGLLLIGALAWWAGLLPRWLTGGSETTAARIDPTLIPVAFGERCGFVDGQGQMVINPQFEAAQFFLADSGLAPVQMGGKWGLIDRQGHFAVNPQFDGIAAITGSRLFVAYLGGRAGIIDARGTYVVNPQFEIIGEFNPDGQAIARSGERWGVIDLRGNFVIPPQFEGIQWPLASDLQMGVSADLVPAQSGGRWGYIDRRGTWVVNPQFASAQYFDATGLAPVQLTPAPAVAVPGQPMPQGQWGYIDRTGRLIIRPQFGAAGSFRGPSLAPVQIGGQWGYIDRTGAFRINPQWVIAGPFTRTPAGWRAVVMIRGNTDPQGVQNWRAGLIDETGAYKVTPQFDGLDSFDVNGRAIVRVGTVAGLIDETGRFVVNPIYERLELMAGTNSYFYAKPLGAAANQGTYEQGWIDRNGQVLSSVRGGICSSSGEGGE